MSEKHDTVEREEWRDIPGYEGLYQASNLGRIRRLRAMVKGPRGSRQWCPGGILIPNRRGPYPSVRLCRDARSRNARVHTLILETFVGPRPNGMEARHFPDKDKSNNRADNLQWGTAAENTKDKEVHGDLTLGERNGCSKLTTSDVIKIRSLCRSRKYPQTEIAKMFGIRQQEVSKINLRIRWAHISEDAQL